jgi:hypothetical protein
MGGWGGGQDMFAMLGACRDGDVDVEVRREKEISEICQ